MRYIKNKHGVVHSVTDEHYDELIEQKGYSAPDDDEIDAFHESTGGEREPDGDAPKSRRSRKGATAKQTGDGNGDGGNGDGDGNGNGNGTS